MKTIELANARNYREKFVMIDKHEDPTSSFPYKDFGYTLSIGIDGMASVTFVVHTSKNIKIVAFSSSNIEKAVFYYNKL